MLPVEDRGILGCRRECLPTVTRTLACRVEPGVHIPEPNSEALGEGFAENPDSICPTCVQWYGCAAERSGALDVGLVRRGDLGQDQCSWKHPIASGVKGVSGGRECCKPSRQQQNGTNPHPAVVRTVLNSLDLARKLRLIHPLLSQAPIQRRPSTASCRGAVLAHRKGVLECRPLGRGSLLALLRRLLPWPG